MRRVLLVIVALGVLLGWSKPASCPAAPLLDNFFLLRANAQGQARAVLYPVDTTAFPSISTFLDVFDASDRFVSGLKAEQLTVLEDGQRLPPAALTEMIVPLQLAVAINPGPILGVRDKLGAQRYEGIVQALGAWAQALPADTPDDLSLVTLSGPIISHASARDWLVSLQAFRPDFGDTVPNLQTLQIAIQTVAVQPSRIGMKRAVFFITPHMDDPNIDTLLAPLIDQAVANNVRVFVWFTDTELYTASLSAAAFTTLAARTGGAYFAAAELQPYPDPETYFAALRRLYSLQYQSAAKAGGAHTLSVEVVGQGGVVQSAEQPFTVDLQPPNPIFVSPPLQILRSPPQDDPYNGQLLQPVQQPLELIVEFPDGHPRPLVRTTLYVDGQIVAENTADPFDTFAWDLSSYASTGEHKLVAEAVDSLGLSKTTTEIPVTVTVVQPPRGLAAFFGRYRQSIILVAVALAALVLLLILFMGRLRALFSRGRGARGAQADPVTQAVTTSPASRASAASGASSASVARAASAAATVPTPVPTDAREKPTRRRLALPKAALPKQLARASAYLRRLQADPLAAPGDTFKPTSAPAIPLAAQEIIFGTDPKQASYVLDDPSLEPRHARITQTANGDYFVVDAGTIGGTWVNFEPVGQEAHLLRHGDVIHFGQLAFRFELKDPPEPEQPKVTALPPQE